MKRTILIAGGSGYIGSKLAKELRKQFTVITLDLSGLNRRSDTFRVDLTKRNVVSTFAHEVVKPDVLIFLTGLAHKKGEGRDYEVFRETNYLTLTNLTQELERAGKLPDKIIFASTISVYGERFQQKVYTEELEPMPSSPYAVTKLEAETFLMKEFRDKTWILRFAPVYSPSFTLNIDRRSKIGRYLYQVGDGHRKLSMCNLNNIIHSTVGIILDEVPNGVYNISDSQSYSYRDLIQYQGGGIRIKIPYFLMRLVLHLGRVTQNIFLAENATKLITDNTFPSKKISKFVSLSATLDDLPYSE